ncbi:hypothetical protein IT568_05370 [bacterium]|nr:hypothetical protein [bacterium]
MIAGTILYFKSFPLEEKVFKDKYLVLLNDGENYPYIVLIITSKQKMRELSYGCQNLIRYQSFCIPKGQCKLSKDSWVQLEDFRELSFVEFFNAKLGGKVEIFCKLSKEITIDLLICAKASEDISNAQIQILEAMLNKLQN